MKGDTSHLVIWCFFCLCLGYGLFGRWESIRAIQEASEGQSVNLSHDEAVFLTLGKNLRDGWDHYHAREWAEAERRSGREPPAYLERPIFKHPPLMALGLTAIHRQGIAGVKNAFWMMLVLGAVTSVAVYGMARCLLSPMWSLVPTAMAWVDPILWVGSVKVWLDLPLTLFCAAALTLAWRGRTHPMAFLGMGLCFGLAFLTKAPAMVVWGATTVLLFADCKCNKGPAFLFGCALPWLMLAPWMAWNFSVLGWTASDVEEFEHVLLVVESHIGWIVAGAMVAGFMIWLNHGVRHAPERAFGHRVLFGTFLLSVAALFAAHSLYSWRLEPRAGMVRNFFDGEPVWFYLERLATLDPLLWPGLVALLLTRLPAPANFLRWVAVAFILTFSLWGNFQSRYVMPAVPLLCVLSAWGIFQMTEYLARPRALWLEKAWMASWLVFAVVRLSGIHQKLTLPNQFTYF